MQNLVCRDYSSTHTHMHIHTEAQVHTQAPAHMSILTIQNLICTQFKQTTNRLKVDEDNSTEWKTRQVYCFGKRNVLRFDSKEPVEGFCLRGRGRVHLT